MSKNKNKKKSSPVQHRPQPKALTPKLERQLEHVDSLLREGETAEAINELEELHQANPRQPDILHELVRISQEVDDRRRFLRYAQRLTELLPGDEDILLATAHAYLINTYVALTIKTYQTFLRRFPNSDETEEVREKIAKLEQALHQAIKENNHPEENWLDIAIQQDIVRFNLEFGYYAEARSAVNQLLRTVPDFIPGLNNLSQIEWLAGNQAPAIAAAQRVLVLDPDNYHALANLSRYLLFSGRHEEAMQTAERLKSIQSEDSDFWIKKLETFSYFGDDAAILETMEDAISKEAITDTTPPIFWHYGAVAAMRLGDEQQARLWWERALEEEPTLNFAQKNLDDLKKPSHERNAPWVYDLAHWISRPEIEKFILALNVKKSGGKAPSLAESKRLLAQHPGLVERMPLMLQRGDEAARRFVLQMTDFFPTEELLASVHEYALGQDGPDSSRIEAMNLLQKHKVILPGTQRMWIRSAWTDILLFGFEITGEPTDIFQHSDEVLQLYSDAISAINEDRKEEAESLMQEALRLEPGQPDLLNNLAGIYSQQGRTNESTAIIEELFAKHPDYFFARTNLANIYIQRGMLDEAAELLPPLLGLEKYHVSEMRALCQTEINLAIAQKKTDVAQSWIQMWESFDKDDPQLEYWKRRIHAGDAPGSLSTLLGQIQKWPSRRKRK